MFEREGVVEDSCDRSVPTYIFTMADAATAPDQGQHHLPAQHYSTPADGGCQHGGGGLPTPPISHANLCQLPHAAPGAWHQSSPMQGGTGYAAPGTPYPAFSTVAAGFGAHTYSAANGYAAPYQNTAPTSTATPQPACP